MLHTDDDFPKPSWMIDLLSSGTKLKGMELQTKICPNGDIKQLQEYVDLMEDELNLFLQCQFYLASEADWFISHTKDKEAQFLSDINYFNEVISGVKYGKEWWNVGYENSNAFYETCRMSGLEKAKFDLPGRIPYQVPINQFHVLVDFVDDIDVKSHTLIGALDPRISYLHYSKGKLTVTIIGKYTDDCYVQVGRLQYPELLEYFAKHKRSDKKNMKFKTSMVGVSNFDVSTLSQEVAELPIGIVGCSMVIAYRLGHPDDSD